MSVMNAKIIHHALCISVVFFVTPTLNAMPVEPQGLCLIHKGGIDSDLDAAICDRLYVYSKFLKPQIVKLPDMQTLQERFKMFVSPEKDSLEYAAASNLARFLDAKDLKFARVMIALEMTVDAIINSVIVQHACNVENIDVKGLKTQYMIPFLAAIFEGDVPTATCAFEAYMQISGASPMVQSVTE
jgi:hypothetical protein